MKFNQRQLDNTHRGQVLFLISIALIAATLVAYEPIRHNEFVSFDDDEYIISNPNVSGGITRDSVIWAFTKSHSTNWHPLTWLSHMLDCEIYGLNPLGHHITNLIIHIAASLLLFLLLSRMTVAIWPSAFVAAVFALHPIHVESVAWAAERKDVLSGLFWMLTMLAYIRYAERPNFKRYVPVLLAFMMGLMAKPMLVTLPFVLLLLDWWPLDRLMLKQNSPTTINQEKQGASAIYQKSSVWHLVAEKIPLFVLSGVSCVITFVVQKQSMVVVSFKVWPLHLRVVNALGCYFNYIMKILYPKGLAALYPFPEKMTIDAAVLAVMGAAILLGLGRRGRRWLVVGVLWYMGTLVPVIGLVQVGVQMMADRYTYLPSIGVFIIIAWGAEEIFSKMRYSKVILASGTAAALIAAVLVTRIQVGYWENTPALYERAVTVTRNNYIVFGDYGLYFCKQGRYEEGLRYLREAVRICPNYLLARQDICLALLKQGKFDEAIDCLTNALQERNDWPHTHKLYYNLGCAYEQKGDLALAEMNYRKALTLKPAYELAQRGLLSVLAKQGKITGPQTTR